MPVAAEKLLDEYEGLVWNLVKKYPLNSEADKEDAFQAGCMGLCEAYNRFDGSKGCEFSTYAYPWVQKFIREFARKSAFSVDIPTHQLALAHKVHKAFVRAREEGCERLSAIKKASALMGLSQAETEDALATYQSHREHNFCIDDPNEAMSLKNEVDVFEAVALSHQVEKVKRRLHLLSNRERDLINLMYLKKDNHCETISDAGRVMGVSKQSAQEFHKKAIAKLKRAA